MTLDEVMEMAAREQFLAVVATLRADSTIQSSLVNAGVLDHPMTGDPTLAFVTYGAAKLRNLRDAAAGRGHVPIGLVMGHRRRQRRADRAR